MSNVVGFPTTHAAAPSRVDPPLSPEYHRAIIAMEHEIAELREAIATQALTIIRYRRRHFKRGLQKQAMIYACTAGVAVAALTLGWKFDLPVSRNVLAQAQERAAY